MTPIAPHTRLSAHDPADRVPAGPPPEDVLARILATQSDLAAPVPTHRAGRAGPRLALAGCLAAVATAAGGPMLAGGGDSPGLVERAYAATSTTNGVLHTVRTLTAERSGPRAGGPTAPAPIRQERWQHGADLHIAIRTPEGVIDQVLDDGKLTIRLPDGNVQRSGEGELAEPLADIATLIGHDELLDFRRKYDADALTDAGPAVFAGREVHRFTVPEQRAPFDGGTLVTARKFLLDPDSGDPVAARTVVTSTDASGALAARTVSTTVIDTIERLPPTPAALARVTPQG